MRNIKFTIEYDGTDFHGWQVQPGDRTVQGDIESALHQLLQEPVRIQGAGRTDQGVHARGQVANCTIISSMKHDNIRSGLNALTRDDIYIRCTEEVPSDFHSRFSARSKIYHYYIIQEPSPCLIRYNWFVPYHLEVVRMRTAASQFIGEKDFQRFSVGNEKDSTRCTVHDITLTEQGGRFIIAIEGDRFLRKMVRGIIGFLHDIGRGRFSPEDVPAAFSGDIKDLYFAPPQGLFLMEVKY